MKCKELASKYNVTPMQVGRLRKKLFPDEEGDLSAQAVSVMSEYFDDLLELDVRQEIEELVKPQFVDSMCSYAQEGRQEVECKINGENGVETVRALIPHFGTPMHSVGKPMRLEVIEYKEVKYYRHASLAGKAWSTIKYDK